MPGGGLVALKDLQDSLTVVNASIELARAAAWAEWFTGRAGVPPNISSKLLVALDETLSNVFSHAFAGAPEGTRHAVLGLRRRAGRLELELTDDGPEFDPTRALVADAEARRARQPGGVGLLFLKFLVDEMHFTRHAGHNRLIIAIHLPQAD